MFRLSPYLLCLIGLIARSRSAIEVDNSLTYLLLRGDPLPQQDDNQNTGLDEAFNADFDLFQRLTEFIDQSEAQPPPPPAGWGDDPQGTFFGRSAIYRGYRTGEYTDGPPDHRNIAEDEQLFFDLSALTEAHRRELQGLRAQQNGEVDSSPGKTPVEEGGPTLKVQTQEMLLVAQQNEHSPNLDPPPKPAAAGPGIGKGKRPRPDAAADEDGEESPELKRLREPEEISEGELDRILDGLLGEVGEKQEEGEEDSTAESPLRDALDPSNHNRDSPGQAGDPGTETPALQFPKAVLPYVPQGIWMVRSRSLAPLGRYPSAETTIALLNRVSQKVFSIFQHRGPVATQVATYTLGEFSIRISFKNPFALIYPAVQHSLDTKIDPSQYLVKRPRFVQAQFDPPLVRVSRPGSDGPPGLRGYDYTASPSLRHWMEMQATSSVPSPRGSRRRMRNKDGMGGMFITTDGLFGFGYRIFRTEDGIPDDVPEDPSHIEQGGTNTAQHQEDPPNNGNDRISQATNGILIVEAPPDPEPQQGGFDIATPLPDESEVATQDGLAAAPLELDAESAVKPADPGNWEMLTLVQSLGVAPGILWYLIRTLSDKVPEPSQPNS